MTAFTFTAEQLQAAPPEVRRWAAGELARALAALGAPRPDMPHAEPQPQALAPTACTLPEAARVFELIAGDAVVTRLFFELARDSGLNTNVPGLHALRLAELAQHVGMLGRDGLIDGLAAIDRAFHQVHPDRAGSLFGFDDAGHVFLHEITQASIRRIWEELVASRGTADREPAPAARYEGFTPTHVGPSEEVAPHAQHAADLPF